MNRCFADKCKYNENFKCVHGDMQINELGQCANCVAEGKLFLVDIDNGKEMFIIRLDVFTDKEAGTTGVDEAVEIISDHLEFQGIEHKSLDVFSLDDIKFRNTF